MKNAQNLRIVGTSAAPRTARWVGGRVRYNRRGEPVWVIEARRNGGMYVITLKVHSEKDALGELALFERDPDGYRAAHERTKKASTTARIDAEVLAAFKADFAPTVGEKHLDDTMYYLEHWKDALKGRDLSKLTLADYRGYLEGLSPARHHISALRSLTHWMRKQGALLRHEDATLDLEVPQAGRARAKGKVAYPVEAIMAMYAHLRKPNAENERGGAQAVRDVIALRTLTGMHHTEIERMAAGGDTDGRWVVTRLEDGGEIYGRVTFVHKNKGEHHQPLCRRAYEAAVRLQERGSAPQDSYVYALMKRAAKDAGLGKLKMRPGALRHSFIEAGLTAGREVVYKTKGVSLETMARAVGHGAVSTTGIYSGAMAPMIVVDGLTLVNEEDPA